MRSFFLSDDASIFYFLVALQWANGKVLVSHSGITWPPRIHDDSWRVGQETHMARWSKPCLRFFFIVTMKKSSFFGLEITYTWNPFKSWLCFSKALGSPKGTSSHNEFSLRCGTLRALLWRGRCGWSHLAMAGAIWMISPGQWPFQGPKLEVPRCTYGPYHIQGLNFRAKLSGKIYVRVLKFPLKEQLGLDYQKWWIWRFDTIKKLVTLWGYRPPRTDGMLMSLQESWT
jgi:hypothetical protein